MNARHVTANGSFYRMTGFKSLYKEIVTVWNRKKSKWERNQVYINTIYASLEVAVCLLPSLYSSVCFVRNVWGWAAGTLEFYKGSKVQREFLEIEKCAFSSPNVWVCGRECQITRTNSVLTQRKAKKKGSFGPNAVGAQAHAHKGSNKHHQITHESVIRNENTVYGY